MIQSITIDVYPERDDWANPNTGWWFVIKVMIDNKLTTQYGNNFVAHSTAMHAATQEAMRLCQ